MNAASQHGNQFLEDICHVSLCRFITYLFIEFLELQLGKIFSVIISHFLQLFLSIVWDWKQIVFLPTKLITDIQFFCVFHVYPSFLMYLAHQLRHQIRSDQSLSGVRLFATPWIAARQASLSTTNSRSSLRLTSIESVMPSSHLIFCRPLLLLPSVPPSIRVFSNESTFCMRYPKYWSFSCSIIPSKEIRGLISFRIDWLDLLAVQELSRVFSNTTVQKHQFFSAQPSSQSNCHILTWPQEKP